LEGKSIKERESSKNNEEAIYKMTPVIALNALLLKKESTTASFLPPTF
jgi:hypothetical protein